MTVETSPGKSPYRNRLLASSSSRTLRCARQLRSTGPLRSSTRLRGKPAGSTKLDTGDDSSLLDSTAERLLQLKDKPAALAIQAALALGFLALIDGGLSGVIKHHLRVRQAASRLCPPRALATRCMFAGPRRPFDGIMIRCIYRHHDTVHL